MEIYERQPTSRRETYRAPRGRVRINVEQLAPFKPWGELEAYLRSPDPDSKSNPPQPRFAQGDHVAIIGPTGTGKTHIALALAELRSYTILIACKPRDPLIDDAQRHGYYVMGNDLIDKRGRVSIEYVDGRPLHSRIVYWPRMAGSMSREKAIQKAGIRKVIEYVRDKGSWSLVIDEGTWVCRDLGLQREVDHALFQFRTMRSSIIILGQRPSWMGRYVLNQPTHLFLFETADVNDRKALGDISGFDSKEVAEVVRQLDHKSHEALYLNTRTREMFRTIAPPR